MWVTYKDSDLVFNFDGVAAIQKNYRSSVKYSYAIEMFAAASTSPMLEYRFEEEDVRNDAFNKMLKGLERGDALVVIDGNGVAERMGPPAS